MKKVLTYKGAVTYRDCDAYDHMNVSKYLDKYEEAGWNVFPTLYGTPLPVKGGIGVVALEQKIKYYNELIVSDQIYIETSLVDIGNKSFTIKHEMFKLNSNELVSDMRAVFVFFDINQRKAIEFPLSQKASFEKFL